MKINTTIIFSVIWLAFLIVFLVMGCLSYQSVRTKLPRYRYEAPVGVAVKLKGIDLPTVVENITKTHNKAVEQLEESIQSEAKTMVAINSVSAFLCLLGFVAQISDFAQKQLKNK